MKRIIIGAAMSCLTAAAFAGGPSCKEQAQEHSLAGTALVSFMTRCEQDALAACSASATDLAGPAKVSFTKKCVHHTVGMKSCSKLLRDSFRRTLLVRSTEAEDESAMLWCHALCGSALPLAIACDGVRSIDDGMQRRADLE
jgi:hypothetical protein